MVLHLLFPLSVLIAGLWAFRIGKLHLIRRYPWLFLYLTVGFGTGILGVFFFFSRTRIDGRYAYDLWWVIQQPITWLLTFGVVFEVFDRLIENYRGLQKLGRIVVYSALGLVGSIVILLLIANVYTAQDLNEWKVFWLKQEQSVSFLIAGSLFLLFLFQRVFHSFASPNIRLVFAVFGLYYAFDAALTLLRGYLGPEFRMARNLVGASIYAVCLMIGLLRFSRAGETEPLAAGAAGRSREDLAGAANTAAQHMKNLNDRLETILRP